MKATIALAAFLLAAFPYAASSQETVFLKSGAPGEGVRHSSIAPLAGVEVVAEYGDALLVRVSTPAARAALSERFEVTPLPNATKIGHWKGSFDPLGGLATGKLAPSAAPPSNERGLHLIQFVGPPKDEWLSGVTKIGAELVSYFPHSAYLARIDPKHRAQLEKLAYVRWIGAWTSEMKFDPETDLLRSSDPSAEVEINFVIFNPGRDLRATAAEKALLRDNGGVVAQEALSSNHEIVRARIRAGALNALAANPNVISVEAYHRPELDDESTSLTVAGHYTGETAVPPPNPNYAAWLTTIGYTGSTVTVGVVDDGVDTSEVHLSGRVTDILSGATAGANGHGHHVAGIAAGSCSHTVDGLGYLYAAGVAPGASVLNQPLLKVGWNNTCGTATDYGCLTRQTVTTTGSNGSTGYVQNNSWGAGEATPMTYTSIEREYDLRVRDANELTPAHEPLVVGFSAGNSGNLGLTRPKSAKNVITTGATDAYRPGVNSGSGPGAGGGCDGLSALPSSNLNMMVCFSSYGNAQDGRVKPDVVAPGGNIASARSGASALWGNIDTNHRWCSGTSQAAPHTAGMAALIVDKWRGENAGASPSPAMVKAKLINSAVEIRTSTSAPASSVYPVTTNLPNNREGWGRMDTMRHLNPPVEIMHRDQDAADLFGASGVTRTFDWVVDSSAEPLYVTLVWTDAAAAINANPALVNDLDLEVIVGGVTYKGNVLATTGTTGKLSVSGGTRDSLNNVENVFLPSVTANATVQVRVIATTINGDGIPNNADTTDQDFALVVYNAKPCTPPAVPAPTATPGPSVDEITIDWSEIAGASGYNVYRSEGACPDGTFALAQTINSGSTVSWTDTGVTGGTTYSYTVSSFNACESAQSSCTDAIALSCSTPQPPTALTTSTPENNTIRLSWTASPTSGVTYTVYRANGACSGGSFSAVVSGLSTTTWDDTSVAGGSIYSYVVSAFELTCESTSTSCADDTATGGPGLYSPATFATGTPQNTLADQPVRWLFNTGATSLVPPGVTTSGVYTVSNDRAAHAMTTGVSGGNWPRTSPMDWKPLPLNAPAQSRPNVGDITGYPISYNGGLSSATRIMTIGTQDGYVYLLNANNGDQIWKSSRLGDMVQATPIGIFRKFGSGLTKDLVLVGSRSTTMVNKFYALDAADGSIVWEFDNGGTLDSTKEMGIVNGGARLLAYSAHKVVFGTRKKVGGTSETLFCLTFTDTGAPPVKTWSASLGDIDGTPIRANGRVLVGNNLGIVHAIDESSTGTATPSWSYDTGDGPVKGSLMNAYASPTDMLYFSTTTKVWAIQDGVTPTFKWSQSLPSPSPPMYTGAYVLVGAGDGRLYQMASGYTTSAPKSVQLGPAGPSVVGFPNYNSLENIAYVGNDAGTVHAVALPLP